MPIYVVNSTTDERGRTVPNIPAGVSWVGNIYEKQGNVRKYLLKTPTDLTGLPGVFGPITQEQIAAAIATDGGTTRGWIVDDVPSWALPGAPSELPRTIISVAEGSVSIAADGNDGSISEGQGAIVISGAATAV